MSKPQNSMIFLLLITWATQKYTPICSKALSTKMTGHLHDSDLAQNCLIHISFNAKYTYVSDSAGKTILQKCIAF